VIQRIASAEAGCKKASDAWAKASERLACGVPANGYGIYHERGAPLRRNLLAARDSINEALRFLDEVDWPTDADYNQL
jgi:hypothetical protein